MRPIASRDEGKEIIRQALLRLAERKQLLVAGTYVEITEEVNRVRAERGLTPITVSGLRGPALEAVLQDLQATMTARGPVCVPEAAVYEWRRRS